MPAEKRIEPFPKDHVWIPTQDGKWTHRAVTAADKERRGLVLQLLSPYYDREQKAKIRSDLENFRWPCQE